MEGIVTLSDVTETIAGNLPNEVEEIDARHDIQKNADGSWTANGHMPLEDLVQYVPLPLDEKREYHTIAGLLMEYLQRIPKPGEEVSPACAAPPDTSHHPGAHAFVITLFVIKNLPSDLLMTPRTVR